MIVRPVPRQASSIGFFAAVLQRLAARQRQVAAVDNMRGRVLHQTACRSDIAGLRAAISPGFAGMRRGGLFDPLYSGLSASAADLDAAISRRTRLHWRDTG
jgi:hypothetical protein